MNILIISPHPDDEVLGCGGTIKKYVSHGDEVFLCIVTKAYTPDWSEEYIERKKKEIEKSSAVLGFKKLFFLDFPTVKLDTVPQKDLNDAIDRIVKETSPRVVFIPFVYDINKDHRLVSEASQVVLRPKPGLGVEKVLFYEVPSETEWASPPKVIGDVFIPNLYEDISDYLDVKIKAMKCYDSEIKEFPHPRSSGGIEALARKRGTECGAKAAEAFMILRELKIAHRPNG